MTEQFQKLLAARAFYFVKAVKIAYSKAERGYLLTVHFRVSKDESSHKKLRFFFPDLESVHTAVGDILECHQHFHPEDHPLIALWTLYLEDFMNNPLRGVSLYRPENILKN